MATIFWKELADHLGSRRFFILSLIILVVAGTSVYLGVRGFQENPENVGEYAYLRLLTTAQSGLPSFLSFLAFFGPLLAVLLGFDAVNSEFTRGTVSRILSQPIYRDSWINGKFLAGLTTMAIVVLSITLLIFGLGLFALGFPPTGEEFGRLVLFVVVAVIYLGFWLALGILYSVLFRQTASSALGAVATWLFFTLFLYMIAGVIADQLVPIRADSTAADLLRNQNVRDFVLRFSPVALFEEATLPILVPTYRGLSLLALLTRPDVPTSPLPIGQSLLVGWPQLVGLLALTAVCFAVAYLVFMRREIRTS
ncbi:ABC transporter permease [Candidatus Bipolaricaulota bacterium]|nr:ABC transporter permease [Candidatus Bipolaricaulota bacterium]